MANMSGKNGISTDKTVFLSLLAGETRLCPDKSPMLRRANACSSTAARTGALFDKSPMLPLPTGGTFGPFGGGR